MLSRVCSPFFPSSFLCISSLVSEEEGKEENCIKLAVYVWVSVAGRILLCSCSVMQSPISTWGSPFSSAMGETLCAMFSHEHIERNRRFNSPWLLLYLEPFSRWSWHPNVLGCNALIEIAGHVSFPSRSSPLGSAPHKASAEVSPALSNRNRK